MCMQLHHTRFAGSLRTACLIAFLIAPGCSSRNSGAEQPPARAANANVLERADMNPNASSFVELIQGRLPGVLVRQRGTNTSIEIRGVSSIRGSSEALIMIDGVESTSRVLMSLNPDDVERVEVVKDGAAAIYGVRGANGVLLITTRRHQL